jgi:hypothetical protein
MENLDKRECDRIVRGGTDGRDGNTTDSAAWSRRGSPVASPPQMVVKVPASQAAFFAMQDVAKVEDDHAK